MSSQRTQIKLQKYPRPKVDIYDLLYLIINLCCECDDILIDKTHFDIYIINNNFRSAIIYCLFSSSSCLHQ